MQSRFLPALAFSLRPSLSSLDEQIRADVKILSELFGVGFADRPLAVEYFGSNSLGAEYFPKVFLRQVTGLHQMLERPLRAHFPNWIAPFLVLINQHSQEFS